jgi:hypothetical protein
VDPVQQVEHLRMLDALVQAGVAVGGHRFPPKRGSTSSR